MVIKEYFPLLVPWLLVTLLVVAVWSWANLPQYRMWWQKLLLLASTAFISFIPIGDLSLADYILSINPNFSIGSLALIVVLLWPKFTGKSLLSAKYLWMFCLWNILISIPLFLPYLGIMPSFDIYPLGYHFSPLFVTMAIITLLAVWAWNPLSVILIAYILAFNLKLLPSPNFFDYMTDGFLLVLSIFVYHRVASEAWKELCGSGRASPV